MISMTQVWERMYIGSRLDAEHLYKENPHGITTVITLCEEEVIRKYRAINYLHIPMSDVELLPLESFDAALDAVFENIRWGTVLLHCGSGSSRAPVIAAAWMHTVGYKNVGEALAEISRKRPITSPSPVLLACIAAYLK